MREAIHNLAGGNKITFLLISIVLLTVTYPFSEMGSIAALIVSVQTNWTAKHVW